MTRLLELTNVLAVTVGIIPTIILSLCKCHLNFIYSRFDDDRESVSPLPVEEPVNQVARHLGRCRVQLEEPNIISWKHNFLS